MSDKSVSFGNTLSSGIQDVAALLPLLGTEQVERHIGSSLEKGYLYSAAATLSLFGSLGAVKVAFATWMATITYPFYGGRWLDDAGFSTPGSVSSMVTIDKETGRYGAELRVQKLLEDQHIDDPNLVKGFELIEQKGMTEAPQGSAEDQGGLVGSQQGSMRSQRESVESQQESEGASHGQTTQEDVDIEAQPQAMNGPNSGTTPQCTVWKGVMGVFSRVSGSVKHYLMEHSWNHMLILSSLLSAVLSITPYLYLMKGHWDRPVSWLFPLLRSFGSFLCVVCTQLVLQRRIHSIANITLIWLKAQRNDHFKDEVHVGAHGTQSLVLEARICEHFKLPRKSILHYLRQCVSGEKQQHTATSEHEELEALLALDWHLVLYHFIMVIGMVMLVAGYVGSFSLVGQTDNVKAPYVWFGLETALSLLRIALWGLNPSWDEGTGLTMSLKLHPLTHSGPSQDSETSFPLITSPYKCYNLGLASNMWGYTSSPQTFIVHNESDFLNMATAWVGPLQRLHSNSITLFYSILTHDEIKQLYTTVQFADSRPPLTFSADTSGDFKVFSTTLKTYPPTGALLATIGSQILKKYDSFINSQPYLQVVDYSQLLSAHLFGRQQHPTLAVRWNLIGLSDSVPDPRHAHGVSHRLMNVPLSTYDKKYMDLAQLWGLKSEYCQARGLMLAQLAARDNVYREEAIDHFAVSFYSEALFLMESFVLELHLWHQETDIGNPTVLQQILPECIQAMQSRIATEKEQAIARSGGYKQTDTRQWDQVLQILLHLRESEDFHPTANALLEHISSLSPGTQIRSVIDKLNRLVPYTILGDLIQKIANFQTEDTYSITPTSQQKLRIMLYAMFFHLQSILSDGFSQAHSDGKLWWLFRKIPDSASWGLYIHSFTPEVLHTNTQCVAVQLLVPSSMSQQKVSRQEEMGDTEDAEEVHREENKEGRANTLEDYLPLIAASKQLTTLISLFDLTDGNRSVVTKFITSNSNLVCLAGMECDNPEEDCEQPHCKAIFTNRQSWKERAQNNKFFASTVGFESYLPRDVQAMGDYIQLLGTGRCLVLFHCSSAGELKVTLNVRRRSTTIFLRATLQSNLDKALIHKVPVRQNKWDLEQVIFCFNVPYGAGEIAIQEVTTLWSGHWKIHDLVKVEWNPESSSKQDTEIQIDGEKKEVQTDSVSEAEELDSEASKQSNGNR
ncbi:hypothetical protein Moror_12050 [Moniliophthora roreri MCA 2997]|uniref:Uncharacterized protein n=2 Tax=Moniliophthora roreri TaxID=221103 RepID=V2WST0_MONRO|nr:hypothetical protein Moror_12050 [Moniliophthora roreri MCA 2997]